MLVLLTLTTKGLYHFGTCPASTAVPCIYSFPMQESPLSSSPFLVSSDLCRLGEWYRSSTKASSQRVLKPTWLARQGWSSLYLLTWGGISSNAMKAMTQERNLEAKQWVAKSPRVRPS